MGKAMNGSEDFPCPLSRDCWSRFTNGDITKDGAVIGLEVIETKTGDGGFIGTNFV